MAAYNDYMMQVKRLVGYDEHSVLYNDDDLLDFINIARAETAAQGQCLRFVTPYQGQILRIHVTDPGSGYVDPAVTLSPPDQPSGAIPFPGGLTATATAQQVGGMISNISVASGGDGYFTPPLVTISDLTGPGQGAEAVAEVAPLNAAVPEQEIYEFSQIDLSPAGGLDAILAVKGVSFIWGNWQWTANRVSFSRYMALTRQWTTNFFAPPEVVCQQGQGTSGSLRIYPIPDQPYPMIWDTLCLPQDLIDDTSYEPIPQPWRRAVPYYAAHLALLARAAQIPQLFNLSQAYFNEKTGGLFNTAMTRARAFSQPGAIGSFYGRI
jgi:hypothetical protein